MLVDIFDPNYLDFGPWERRIYGDPMAQIFATVDEEDYLWAIKWLWDTKRSRGKRAKLYICRQITERHGSGVRFNSTAMLHVEIQKRTGILPPSELHTMVDHRDGNSLNCRRANLRWATPSMNRINLGGEYGHDLMEG